MPPHKCTPVLVDRIASDAMSPPFDAINHVLSKRSIDSRTSFCRLCQGAVCFAAALALTFCLAAGARSLAKPAERRRHLPRRQGKGSQKAARLPAAWRRSRIFIGDSNWGPHLVGLFVTGPNPRVSSLSPQTTEMGDRPAPQLTSRTEQALICVWAHPAAEMDHLFSRWMD